MKGVAPWSQSFTEAELGEGRPSGPTEFWATKTAIASGRVYAGDDRAGNDRTQSLKKRDRDVELRDNWPAITSSIL